MMHDHSVSLGMDIFGNIQRFDNLLNDFERDLNAAQDDLAIYETQLATAKVEVEKPFLQENELKTKSARLDEWMSWRMRSWTGTWGMKPENLPYVTAASGIGEQRRTGSHEV